MRNSEIVLVLTSALLPLSGLAPAFAQEGSEGPPVKPKAADVIVETPKKEDMKKSSDRLYLVPVNPSRSEAKGGSKAQVNTSVDTSAKTKSISTAAAQKAKPSLPGKKAKPTASVKTAKVKTTGAKSIKTAKQATREEHGKTASAIGSSQIKPALFEKSDNIISASLNKNGASPHYRNGEKLKVSVTARRDCNLLVFNYDGTKLTQLFPNAYQEDPFLKAGETMEIGGERSKFDFKANNDGSKASHEKIFVYAYPVQSDDKPISLVMNTVAQSPFRSADMNLDQYKKLVKESKVFFSRSVSVVPKNNVKAVSFENQDEAPNKIELSMVIDGR